MKAGKQQLESLFIELLERLQPDTGYMQLFREVVLDVWRQRQGDAHRLRRGLEAVVSQKRERLDRLDEAFIHERAIAQQTYERQRDQIREQLALARMELSDAVESQLDVDGVLAFAEHLLTNAARLWMELDLDRKQQPQQVLFPEGVRFDGEKTGTAVTCLAFKQMPPDESGNSGMASPPRTGLILRETHVLQIVAAWR